VYHLVIIAGAVLATWTALAIPAGILIGRRLRRLDHSSAAPPRPAATDRTPEDNRPHAACPTTNSEPEYQATTPSKPESH
jgi:hypothetical protein